MACFEWIVSAASDGQRVDDCAQKQLQELSWSVIQSAFKRRDVKINGVRVKPDQRVSAGDCIQLYCMEQKAEPLRIVYEDGDALLIDKRAGISVEDDGNGASLSGLALQHVRQANPAAETPLPCHRLDVQTCGLVLFAKTAASYEILTDAFRARTLDKRYQCLVRGTPKPAEAECTAWLVKDAAAARVSVYDHPIPGANRIVTGYETLEAGPVSRLRIHLITGRTHQIRAHMAALGHPLLGDDVYGDRAFNRLRKARRLMLCADELTLWTDGRLPLLDGRTFHAECPF